MEIKDFMEMLPVLELILLAVILLTAAVIDIRSLYVPDLIHIGILALAAVSLLTGKPPGISSRICGCLIPGGLLLLISILTKGGIGGGDIKLAAASGCFLGFPGNLLALMLAYIAAGLIFAFPLLTGRMDKSTPVPMIPFFAASILVSAVFGERIIGWYLHLFIV